MYDIFLSYSRHELTIADQLYERLTEQGHRVWFDIKGIPVGTQWQDTIFEGLDRSDVFVLLVSNSSMASPNVRAEWERALEKNKRIILVQFETPKLPDDPAFQPLLKCEHLQLYTGFDKGVKTLCETLQSPYKEPDTPLPQGGHRMLPWARRFHFINIFRLILDITSLSSFLILVVPALLNDRAGQAFSLLSNSVLISLFISVLVLGWLGFRIYNTWQFRYRNHIRQFIYIDLFASFLIYFSFIMEESDILLDAFIRPVIDIGGQLRFIYIVAIIIQAILLNTRHLDLWGGARGAKRHERATQAKFWHYLGWVKLENIPSYKVAVEYHQKDRFRAKQLLSHLERYHQVVDVEQDPNYIFILMSRDNKAPSASVKDILVNTDNTNNSAIVPILLDNTSYRELDREVTSYQALNWSDGVTRSALHLLSIELDEPDKLMRQLGVFPLKSKKVPHHINRFQIGLLALVLFNIFMLIFLIASFASEYPNNEFPIFDIVAISLFSYFCFRSVSALFNVWRRGSVLWVTGFNWVIILFILSLTGVGIPFAIVIALTWMDGEARWWFSKPN